MASASVQVSPYRGLMPFQEDDASYFFGRDIQREIILNNLLAFRLTLLYGPSGVGKSSVLLAGVAPRVRRMTRRSLAGRGTPEFALATLRSWDERSVESLLHSARKAVVEALGRQLATAEEPADLASSLEGLSRELDGTLLIILDQFEDYLLHHQRAEGDDSFAAQFVRAVNHPDLRANFLISIREDALARLDCFQGHIPNLFEHLHRLPPLSRAEAREAIVGPIRIFKHIHHLSVEDCYNVQDDLVETVLDELETVEVHEKENWAKRVKRVLDPFKGALTSVVHATFEQELIEIASHLKSNFTSYLQKVMIRLWEQEKTEGSRTLQLATLNKLGGIGVIYEKRKVPLDAIAHWEREFPGLELFWVILPQPGFLDPLSLETMVHNLEYKSTTYLFVVKNMDQLIGVHDLYQKLSKTVRGDIRGKIVGTLLNAAAYDDITRGKYYWVANPLSPNAEGFEICFDDNGIPVAGLELKEELSIIIERLSIVNYVAERARIEYRHIDVDIKAIADWGNWGNEA